MSIKNEAFGLCDYISSLSCKVSIKNTIKALSGKDKFLYHQYANKQDAQFLGFLLCEENKDLIYEQLKIPIASLTDDEKTSLLIGHNMLVGINRECAKPFHDINYQLDKVLDAYSIFTKSKYPHDVSVFWDDNIFDDLLLAMKNTSIYNFLKDFKLIDMTKYPKSLLLEIVETFNQKIIAAEVHSSPEDFNELRLNNKEPEHSMFKYLSAIMCVREMIKSILQLCYQAFLNDKLAVIDDDNLVSIDKNTGNICGNGLTVTVQPNESLFYVNCSDIILFNPNLDYIPKSSLCRVEGITISFNEWGQSQTFKLRVLNDDLNPYGGLI